MAGQGGVGGGEVGGGGCEQPGHGRHHSAWELHNCIWRHSFGIVVRVGRYNLVRTGGQAGVHAGPHTGPRGHGPSLGPGRAGRATCGRPGARSLTWRDLEAGCGGGGPVGEQGLRVPARDPGIVRQGQHGGQPGQVLLATAGNDGVGAREAGDLTGSRQLEILLLQEELLLGVQPGVQLLVAVNSLEVKQSVSGRRKGGRGRGGDQQL